MPRSSQHHRQSVSSKFYIGVSPINTQNVYNIINTSTQIDIDSGTALRLSSSRALLERLIKENRTIYGVNTGLGGLVNWLVPEENASELQNNLISAVATNVGDYLDDRFVLASMLARINSLARGVSAISLQNFNILLKMFNKGVVPCIPSKGSLGASGDLGPLACVALVGTGKWKARYKGSVMPGREALRLAGISPMILGYKEGLSLVNGTSTMTGMAAMLIEDAIKLIKYYDIVSALSIEGLGAIKKPFNPIVHREKLHPGQQTSAENIWNLLKDSKLVTDEDNLNQQLIDKKKKAPIYVKTPIEDAYSIRCTPQILGPIRDNLKSIRITIDNELNSSSDNPLVIPSHGDVFHNGHFHGQYIAMAMDQLCISLSTLANLSDRRIDRFMDSTHSNGLPPFLCSSHQGIRLGLMGGQFMAASLASEIRSLCSPVSIQSLTTTGDFQDIISMGFVAARRAHEILTNVRYIVAFELLCAAQSVDFRGADRLSSSTRIAYESVRKLVKFLDIDEPLTDHIESLSKLLESDTLLLEVEQKAGRIDL
ncbi:MAG: aromatic amino acid lyase [Chlamydiales bacterium]|nr:aromatic amino acid lyase [Chlamydiales bacterium]